MTFTPGLNPSPKPAPVPQAPKKGVRRRNRRRYSANWLRAYGSPERCDWIAAQPCVACGCRGCENHHIKSGGKSRKADARFIVPLCGACHDRLHDMGSLSFQDDCGIDFDKLADETELKWQFHSGSHTETPHAG